MLGASPPSAGRPRRSRRYAPRATAPPHAATRACRASFCLGARATCCRRWTPLTCTIPPAPRRWACPRRASMRPARRPLIGELGGWGRAGAWGCLPVSLCQRSVPCLGQGWRPSARLPAASQRQPHCSAAPSPRRLLFAARDGPGAGAPRATATGPTAPRPPSARCCWRPTAAAVAAAAAARSWATCRRAWCCTLRAWRRSRCQRGLTSEAAERGHLLPCSP